MRREYQSTTLLGNDDFKRIVMAAFVMQYDKARTVIAYPSSEPTEIAGWICYRPDALVFGMVKRPYRGLGVWRGLRDLVMAQRGTMPCLFKPDRFSDGNFKATPWLSLT